MLRGKLNLRKVVALFIAVFLSHCAYAQVDSLLRVGEACHQYYRFGEAIDAYDMALDIIEDAVEVDTVLAASVYDKVLLSENGTNMSKFVRKPAVAGREKFSLEEFFLYYPVENKSWRRLPNVLDADDSSAVVHALYASDWSDVHYYSAKDENGVRSIFMTEFQDTVWSVPVRVEELSTTASNEIYPMLSPDGKTIYFASDGLYGLGGYDIYRSEWDDAAGKWSMPQNMGFPFSSPADDFLYVDSEDERYSVFASNRGCPADSVWVYAIEYERYPVHSPVTDPDELMELATLMPEVQETAGPTAASEKDDVTDIYMSQMDRVRILKDSIDVISSDLDELRRELDFSNDESMRFQISSDILELEKKIPALQVKLEEAKVELRKTEEEFLKRGVFVRPSQTAQPRQEQQHYEFTRLSWGDSLEMNIAVPEKKFDYSFQILDEAVFAEDQSLPSGIVYQIQLLGGAHKVGTSALKGLSPVYEHRSPSGMYIYRVGRFTSYNEALDCVYKVRDLGFRGAYLCAFEDGKEITVAKARTLQEQLRGGFSLCEIRMIPDSGELDPAVVDLIYANVVGKDIKRYESEDGTQVFSVGPFDDRDAADRLVSSIKEMIQGSVVCESIFE